MSKAKVYVKFPKAGLGNMMLTWSRAYIFSQLNDLEMHTSSWAVIHWGAVVRREGKRRFYFGYFRNDSFLKKIRFFYYLKTRTKIIEPPVARISAINNELILFNKIFIDYDFFREIRPYKDLIKKAIFDMLQPRLKEKFKQFKKPVIGIHIRRGDFNRGSTITPLSFFIDVITQLRKNAGLELPVTIFTDAEPLEIEEITRLNNISVAETKQDILDILLLASSEVVVLSIGSTFSYWAAFLTDGKIIKNEGEWHVPFRAVDAKNFNTETTWKMKPGLRPINQA